MEHDSFKKETFWNLLSRIDVKNLTIPIIQRSYTQGGRNIGSQKDDAIEKKGQRFINTLYDALVNDNPIELDFIYASCKNNVLYPLDGQQRLTTLFLLHWYIAQKEEKLDEKAQEILQKFTYETRVSSRYFCEQLTQFTINNYYMDSIKETIINQSWFLLSWQRDPSVSSMLDMLEKIDSLLKTSNSGLWEKITQDPDRAPITFFYTPLESFDLTDDLYIKMNARGKELTGFENIKAEFNKKIDDKGWDAEKEQVETFGHKIDTDWTDLFWKFRNSKNEIDIYILRFMSAVMVNCFASNDKKGKDKRAEELFNFPISVTPDYLDSESSYLYLYDFFETFCRNEIVDSGLAQFDIVFWLGTAKKFNLYQFFERFISKDSASTSQSLTWQERVVFFGLYLYLKNNNIINIDKLSDWLIFIRNLIANGTVDSYDTFRSAQNRLNDLVNGTSDIYTFLLEQQGSIVSGFSAEQMREELQKAKIYKNSPEAKNILQKLENRNFCRGKLQFIFYCLDITDRVSDIERLKKLKTIIFNNLKNENLSNEFKRCMFTITDLWIDAGWCGALGEKKYYIISTIEHIKKHYAFNGSKRDSLKTLLLKLFDNTLPEIINLFQQPDDMPNWKWQIITEYELLDNHCESNHFTLPFGNHNSHCHLLYVRNPWTGYTYHWHKVE